MNFEPKTTIYFAHTGVDGNNKLVCKTQDEVAIIAMMPGNLMGTMEETSFQRADGFFIIRADHKDIPYYKLMQCDTVVYKNEETDSAFWIFGNILSVDWRNPDCSFVSFKIDHFMTYQNMIDWDSTYAYIEREHVKEDWASDAGNPLFTNNGPGEDFNVVPDTPFYHWEKVYKPNKVLVSSPYDSNAKPTFTGREVGGLYTSLNTVNYEASGANSFFSKVAEDKDASINNIVDVQGIPDEFIRAINGTPQEYTEKIPGVHKANITTFPIEYNNSKCWSAPYVTIRLMTSDGTSLDFAPQWLGNDVGDYDVKIKITGAGKQFGGAAVTLDNNAGAFDWKTWQDFTVMLTELPKCPWTADGYTDWSAVNRIPNMIKALAAISGGFMGMLGVGGNANSGRSQLTAQGSEAGAGFVAGQAAAGAVNQLWDTASTLATMYQTNQSHKATGATVNGGNRAGNPIFDIGQDAWGFKIVYYTVQNYIMRSIDQFFDRFGYRVNVLKKLERENRPIWTFIKTAECHVAVNTGVPYVSEMAINQMFNSGVTMWKLDKYLEGRKIGDFSNAKENRGIAGG